MQLPDLLTEDFTIIGESMDRIHKLTQFYSTHSLRIDRANRIRKNFWPELSKAGNVFTPSGVLINDIHYAAQYKSE